ncbi:hypothetical protein BpHYR1_047343 [Brachionus plicatilis]|uniref:Uncharacterized protein n=1 Tax=Brachionus plicatilis TaxID=10195 RepID=A0A3M7PGC3_BRAPC|nr:hypothetical protein BpHYR1_047343 [Brachionus plicatilis]
MTRVFFDVLRSIYTSKYFDSVYSIALDKAKKLNIMVQNEFRLSRKSKPEDTKEFFKNHVYVSCLEYLTKNIKERVIENFSELISAFGIFQKNFLIKPETAKENLEILVNFYSGDIEDDLNVVFNEYKYFSEWILNQELVESVKEVEIGELSLEDILNELEKA